jgi:hypothetical protein
VGFGGFVRLPLFKIQVPTFSSRYSDETELPGLSSALTAIECYRMPSQAISRDLHLQMDVNARSRRAIGFLRPKLQLKLKLSEFDDFAYSRARFVAPGGA